MQYIVVGAPADDAYFEARVILGMGAGRRRVFRSPCNSWHGPGFVCALGMGVRVCVSPICISHTEVLIFNIYTDLDLVVNVDFMIVHIFTCIHTSHRALGT
jgi:hypothetical protein